MRSGLIQVSDMSKRSVLLSKINFAMAGYLLLMDLMFAYVTLRQLDGPGFGLISPARRSRMLKFNTNLTLTLNELHNQGYW